MIVTGRRSQKPGVRSQKKTACFGLLVSFPFLLLLLPRPGLAAQASSPGAYFVPGDPKAGMRTFFEKGCARCHAVLGEGGRTAPDLGRAPAGHLSAAELVAAMWNHAPAMWEKIQVERLASPKFSESEMTNLFAFLYSVRSLDEPGDPERGRRLFAEKHCLDCHAIAATGGAAGPDLRQWAGYRNPVSWIQAMWNHGLAMQTMMARRGLAWPQFQATDMADMIAYIRTQSAAPVRRAHLRQADSESGRRLFVEKGCANCHPVRGRGGRRAPDLATSALPRTLGQFAGLMWNHAPAMWEFMQARSLPRPEFSNQEMAGLIAYLFTERYFEASGDAGRGRRLFTDKGCAGCHGSGGTSLERFHGTASPVAVAAALWNHGPLMLEKMQAQKISWPRFRPGEILDLMEFLQHGPAQISAARRRP